LRLEVFTRTGDTEKGRPSSIARAKQPCQQIAGKLGGVGELGGCLDQFFRVWEIENCKWKIFDRLAAGSS
jgi:hypothetical protein